MADAYLTFDTKMNTGGFKAGLGQITGMFGKLAAVMGVALGVTALVQFGKEGVKAASEMSAKFKGLEFLLKANGRSIQGATSFIQEFTADGLVPMTSAYEAYKNMVSRGYDTSQIEQMLTVMKDAAVYNRQGQFSMGEAIEKATMGLRMENSLLTDSVGIQKNVAKMWAEYAKEIGTTANNLTMAQKRQAEFNGFMKEGGIFAGAAAEYTDSYAGRVSTLSASFLNLKVAVGNAVIPIINAVIPVLKRAVDWLTKAFNLIGVVMNELFGTDVGAKDIESLATNAESGANAMGEMAANTEAAGEAAKGALAAFDKLNVLAQAESSPASNEESNGLLPPIDEGNKTDSELDKVQLKIQTFIENIKGFFQPLQEPLAKLGEAFKTLGELILTGIGWALENILKPFGLWLVGSVAPVFIDIIAKSIGVLNAILTALQPLGQWLWDNLLKPIAEWTGGVIVAVLEGIVNWLTKFSEWISTHQETVQTIAILIGSFAAAWGLVNIAIGIWNVVGAIAAGVTTLFGAAVAFLTSPIGLVVLAIGALIAIGVLLWKNWDAIKEAAGNVWGAIKLTVTGVWDAIKGAWSGVKQWFDERVLTPIKTAFKTAWDAIGNFMKAPFIAIGKFVKGIFNGLIGFLNGLIGGFERAINFIISALNKISVNIPDWVPLIGGKTFGVNLQPVTYGRIPYLASGAVIPPNAPFAAVLGDQRSGKNIEAPLKTIEQAVDNALARRGGAGGTISFDVDEAGLMRYLHPKFTAETWRTGNSLARKAGAA